MRVTDLRVNHVVEPIGFQMDSMVFTYKVRECEGTKQEAARLLVSEDPDGLKPVYDTGFCNLDSLGVPADFKKKPHTRYYFTITVKTDAGEEASETSFFETGKMDEPFSGKWITCETGDRHPIFRKNIGLTKEVKRARLYICGLGLYEAFLNGDRISEERLTPYCTSYDEWVQYQTYDVTDFLADENELRVDLGCGWYLGRFGYASKPGQEGFFDPQYKLILDLRIEYADGSVEVIGSDDSFLVSRSNITFSNIYDGERVDDTLAPSEEVPAAYLSEEQAEKLHLTERLSVPVEIHEEVKPVELIHTPAGEEVFDLGQNLAGVFRLKVHEPKGTKIHVQVGEVLQGGNFYRDNLRTALAEYIYISDGEPHVLEPKFTYYGYRYAKVTGVSDLTLNSFTGLVYYSDVTPVWQFETGKAKLNKLMQNISWGQKGNFIDVPTDCPQRDERMGWTADTQVFVPTALYLTESYAFYKKYLYDLRKEQSTRNGAIPAVIPAFGVEEYCSVWGDACTIIPWDLYLYYGDVEILRESLDSMAAWVDYISSVDGTTHHWREVFHFGDWLALDHPSGKVDEVKGGTEDGFVADVYYMHSADLVSKAAAVLAEHEQSSEQCAAYRETEKKYAELSARIRKGILDEYYSPNGRCTISTQTAYVLSLYFGLTSNEAWTVQALLNLLRFSGNKFKTGFVGTPFLARVLSKYGYSNVSYQLLHNEEYPGWLYEINLGATTVWERWNSMMPDGSVSSTGMNSFNHYAYGSVGQWMWETMAGIQPDEAAPGFRHVYLKPVPDFRTKSLNAAYDSPVGEYHVEWEVLSQNEIHIECEVPFGATATLTLPYMKENNVRELQSGRFELTYTTDEPVYRTFGIDDTMEALLTDERAREVLCSTVPHIQDVPRSMWGMTFAELMNSFHVDEEKKAGLFKLLSARLSEIIRF